ncbi:tail assembly protein [Pseudomonas phage PlaquesPlease]|uniref:Tail assembly protein n=1 Tax=Pseudomonas phage PlaquesPlease TaxID=2762289 RepID=A0A7G8LJU6_9CAUD|nr:tail assembly protein [Pseudomonas phage PlaquesPlease]
MGLGKSLKKAVKKITKVAKGAVGATIGGGLLGGDKPEGGGAAVVEAPPPPAAAAPVQAPLDGSTTENTDTEADKKSSRSRGKRGLSVARSTGTGLNV